MSMRGLSRCTTGKQIGRLNNGQRNNTCWGPIVLCFPSLASVMGFLWFKCTSLTLLSQKETKLLIHKQFSCPAVQRVGKQDAPKCIMRLPNSPASSVFTPRARRLSPLSSLCDYFFIHTLLTYAVPPTEEVICFSPRTILISLRIPFDPVSLSLNSTYNW